MSAHRPTLALLGLRGCGKSTVGRLLAARRAEPFVDLDDETLRQGRFAGWRVARAGELLERAGPARFRELEALALRRLLEPSQRLVLATGGGVVEREDNRVWLARSARSVFLSVALGRLEERLRAEPGLRPPLLGRAAAGAGAAAPDAAAELGELLRRREPAYRALAQVVIECGDAPPDEIVARIQGALAD